MPLLTLDDIDLSQKRVLIREDFNVPLAEGRIANDARLRAALPTILQTHAAGAAVILISHLGRPKEGEYDAQFSLAPIAEHLSELLKLPVRFAKDWLDGVEANPGDIILCENVRFNVGEKSNDAELAKRMAKLADVFVMDAFATAHRKQASTYGVAEYVAQACAGPLLMKEITALDMAIQQPQKPVAAVIGGAKVSSKLTILETLANKVDKLIVGGGIANTFMVAAGLNVGKSLYEEDLVPVARKLIDLAEERRMKLPIPTDVVVAKSFSADAQAQIKSVNDIEADDMILDIGPDTAAFYATILKNAATIIWSGPIGVFEFDQFGEGTKAVATAVANSHAYSLAGGGDTVAAIEKYHVRHEISYVSTGGGAFLMYIEGSELPALSILEKRHNDARSIA